MEEAKVLLALFIGTCHPVLRKVFTAAPLIVHFQTAEGEEEENSKERFEYELGKTDVRDSKS